VHISGSIIDVIEDTLYVALVKYAKRLAIPTRSADQFVLFVEIEIRQRESPPARFILHNPARIQKLHEWACRRSISCGFLSHRQANRLRRPYPQSTIGPLAAGGRHGLTSSMHRRRQVNDLSSAPPYVGPPLACSLPDSDHHRRFKAATPKALRRDAL
jgi:hypothetical protein